MSSYTLKDLHDIALETERHWSNREGSTKITEAPWPADCACYYCGAYEELGKFACSHCIHNPKSSVFSSLNEQHHD